VVLVDDWAANPVPTAWLLNHDVPHLSVVVGESATTVGPFVVPGVDPCLRCLDLHRRDADPNWIRLLTQTSSGGAGQPAEDPATASAAAGLAALAVLAHLDGREGSARGTTLRIARDSGTVTPTRWTHHADCGCLGLPEALGQETMIR
jgi:bacteriocin biosynthesis cyclodehydratase domain-containing protein